MAGPGPESWAPGDLVELGEVLGWSGRLNGRVVGRGPRGATVRASQPDGAEVAVKCGPPITDHRARKRYAEAAEGLRAVEPGRHVLRVLAGGIGPLGHPWEVTPWMPGGSLADRLEASLPADVVADVAVGAGLGLADLHRQGMLHADLRPGNLLIADDATVMLTGMAVAAGIGADGAQGTGEEVAARLAHLPPEVLEGRPWSVAADIWALGSCLHTLLSGRPPWAREATEGPTALVLAMATGRPPGLRPAGTPAWLGKLIDGCLAVDEAARPADGSTVAAMARHRVNDRVDTILPSGPTPEGQPLGSSYLLDDPIGSGSSGLVWRGHRRLDGKPVAVKVLRSELVADPDSVARFLRERTTLVGIEHPNVVPIMDLVAEGATLAIVMELVAGRDLRQLLKDDGPLDPADACQLLAQTAAGVAAVHRAGIVHRDLKPENILVQGSGPERTARVTDFGIARAAAGPSVTRADQLLGTAEYLAPEVVSGQAVTTASDVYALGVLAYELLAGQRPFHGDHPAALLQAHLQWDPAPLGGLPDGLWELLVRTMAKQPTPRPNAEQLAEQLSSWAPRVRGAHVQVVGETQPSRAAVRSGPVILSDPPPRVPTAMTAVHAPARVATPPPGADPGGDGGGWAPGGPPGVDPPDGAGPARPTEAWSSWRSRPVPSLEGPGGDERRSRRRPIAILVIVAVVLIGAGSGAAYALTRHPTVFYATSVDVTQTVAVGGTSPDGTASVTITWADASAVTGFQLYTVYVQGKYYPPPLRAGTTKVTLTEIARGYVCFRAYAVIRVKKKSTTPAGVPRATGAGQECQDIP